MNITKSRLAEISKSNKAQLSALISKYGFDETFLVRREEFSTADYSLFCTLSDNIRLFSEVLACSDPVTFDDASEVKYQTGEEAFEVYLDAINKSNGDVHKAALIAKNKGYNWAVDFPVEWYQAVVEGDYE